MEFDVISILAPRQRVWARISWRTRKGTFLESVPLGATTWSDNLKFDLSTGANVCDGSEIACRGQDPVALAGFGTFWDQREKATRLQALTESVLSFYSSAVNNKLQPPKLPRPGTLIGQQSILINFSTSSLGDVRRPRYTTR